MCPFPFPAAGYETGAVFKPRWISMALIPALLLPGVVQSGWLKDAVGHDGQKIEVKKYQM